MWNGSYGSVVKFIDTAIENVILFVREKDDAIVVGNFKLFPEKEEVSINNDQILDNYNSSSYILAKLQYCNIFDTIKKRKSAINAASLFISTEAHGRRWKFRKE